MRLFSFDFTAIRQAFAIRNFAMYTAGNSVSLVGMWVQRLAVGWLVWDLTKSGTWLGAASMAEFLPSFVITPLGGVISDRLDRRKVSFITQGGAAMVATLLWLLTVLKITTPEILLGCVFLNGVLSSINQTSRIALIPSLVPRALVGPAIALNAAIFNVARFIGPVVAGALIAGIGTGWAFFVNALSYGPLLYALAKLDLPELSRPAGKGKNVSGELLDGLRYTMKHVPIATLMALMGLGSILARATIELLPGFAGAVFNRGAAGLATFTSAGGLGAIIAALWLAQRKGLQGLTMIVLAAVLLNGVTVAIFALTDIYWVAVILMAASGFSVVASGSASQTLIQIAVQDDMRGRVLSLWLMITRGGPALGAILFGWLSERFGFGWPTVIGGTATAILAAAIFPKLRSLSTSLEKHPEGAAPLRGAAPVV